MDEEKKLAALPMFEFNPEEEMKLEVGITYTGSFRLAPSGMIVVKPYKQGTKPNNLKKLVDGDRHAIYSSKNVLRIVLNIHRGDKEYCKNAFQEIVIQCYKDLCELNI